jgi:pimeloyl-ACP methyl ester carboxylesterase
MTDDIVPFAPTIPEADLEDLRDRLRRTRWPDEWPGSGWDLGLPLPHARGLVEHWATDYDWRETEARLARYPQFTTVIDGQRIHFLHVRSAAPGALPLVLTHGWPMSVLEYLDVIGPLTDPAAHGGNAADAFDVVIPSRPGYGFSGPTDGPGWNTYRTAQAWSTMMRRLGYERYGAHGNDGGSQTSPHLGRVDPEGVVGVHVTQVFSFPSGDPSEFDGLSPDDFARLEFLQAFQRDRMAYNLLQSSQPQTIAYALHDSPVAQLAWSAQLFREEVPTRYVLDNVTLYWLTQTGASAARSYWDEAHTLPDGLEPTTTPLGVSVFANDFRSIRRFADRDHKNIVSWVEHDRGGHFAPEEVPDLIVDDLRAFFRPLR